MFAPMPDFSKKVNRTLVRSGLASDPTVWDGGRPLADGDWFGIDSSGVLTWDLTACPRLGGFVCDGTLDLGTALGDKVLNVATPVFRLGSLLQIGDCPSNTPLNGSLVVNFLNEAPDPVFDPAQFGTGLLTTGARINLCGSADKVAWVWSPSAKAGDISLTLLADPAEWVPGDQVLIPGCFYQPVQDELRTIASVSGRTVTLDRPLTYDHLPLPGPQGETNYLPVANLTRRIVFRSENPTGTRGHIMFMRDMATGAPTRVDACHAAVLDCGRTRADLPPTDPQFDDSGILIPGTADNVRARYSWHEHRQGQTAPDGSLRTPSVWDGIVVVGTLKWGFNNHDSIVNATNLVGYGGGYSVPQGALFATERGTELGTYQNCLAVRTNNDMTPLQLVFEGFRQAEGYGHFGTGFWLQGPGVVLKDNAACGHPRGGIAVSTEGPFVSPSPGVLALRFPTAYLPAPLPGVGGDPTMRQVPYFGISGNTVFGCGGAGVFTWQHEPAGRSRIADQTTWGCPYGVDLEFTLRIDLDGPTFRGPDCAAGSVGVRMNAGYSRDLHVTGASIGGYEIGSPAPGVGQDNEFAGGWWSNVYNFDFWNQKQPTPVTILDGVVFTAAPTLVPVPAAQLAGRTPFDYRLPAYTVALPPGPWALYSFFGLATFLLSGGRQLYFREQLPSYVPFPVGGYTYPDWFPTAFLGLTNQQLWDAYGLAVAGALAPADAVPLAGSTGLVGSPAPQRPQYQQMSLWRGSLTDPYCLWYQVYGNTNPYGIVKETTAAPLVAGTNLLTRTLNGQKYTFFVYGQ